MDGDGGGLTDQQEPVEFTVRSGVPLPLGVTRRGDGFNFTIFSRNGTLVWLELYDEPSAGTPTHRFRLDPDRHRSGDVWHIWIGGVEPGQLYGYRIDGPYAPLRGHRFNPNKLLLDPRATAISAIDNWDYALGVGYDPTSPLEDLSFSTVDNAAVCPKCVVTDDVFDWEGDRLLRLPWSDMVIYETHVRGLTIHPSSLVADPGTYAGVIEKIPYLQELGITAVELLPVQEFNEQGIARINPLTGVPLRDYWGYDPTVFTAPMSLYSSLGTSGGQVTAFKQMVKALHAAGIEVIIDIVLNHTAEGNQLGPTFNGRGIDNTVFYILDKDNPRYYRDFTGTGNTVKADRPLVRDYLLDGLRYWVSEMHVDGFRFDLAAVLGRDELGHVLPDPPLLERIADDIVLRDAKLIAEAWDAAGAYQLGEFATGRWAEWNGRFRDDVRQFWRGDQTMRGEFASRLAGSADIFGPSERGPQASINYVTSHDGFTLNDLVSYERKHNEANGEFNRDGPFENYAFNYGVEGPTEIPSIEIVRRRQIKNFLLTLFVARGAPMLLGGDEFRRTQLGNNNAYCQDNEISWYNWEYAERNEEIVRFTRNMIAMRREFPVLSKNEFYTEDEIAWFGPEGRPPQWGDPTMRSLACMITGGEGPPLFMIFNPFHKELSFILAPPPGDRRWYRKVDTTLTMPDDFRETGDAEYLVEQRFYLAGGRSSVILVAR